MDSKQAIIKDCNEAISKLEKAIAGMSNPRENKDELYDLLIEAQNLAHEAAESFYLFYIEDDDDEDDEDDED